MKNIFKKALLSIKKKHFFYTFETYYLEIYRTHCNRFDFI